MKLEKLQAAHEALLNTLAASKSAWLQKVVKNARAHYEKLKEEVE